MYAFVLDVFLGGGCHYAGLMFLLFDLIKFGCKCFFWCSSTFVLRFGIFCLCLFYLSYQNNFVGGPKVSEK